jgi:hypothetical protein
MVVWLLLAGISWAGDDEKTEDRKVIYRQRTEIDFEGVDVEALLVKPQGTLILERKQASFNPMINLRKDFNAEIEQSTNEIK